MGYVCELGNVTCCVVSARVPDGVQEKNSHNKTDSVVEQQEAGEGEPVEYYFASDARSVGLSDVRRVAALTCVKETLPLLHKKPYMCTCEGDLQ